MEEVIARLIAAVDASGMKHNHIARVSGLGKTKLSKILNRKQEPAISDLIAIARAINVDPGRLFTDGELVIQLEELREAHVAAAHAQDSRRLAAQRAAVAWKRGIHTDQDLAAA